MRKRLVEAPPPSNHPSVGSCHKSPRAFLSRSILSLSKLPANSSTTLYPPSPPRSPLLTRSSLPTQFPRGAFLFPPAARPRCLSACWSASDSITLSPPPCPSVTLLVQAHVYLWCGAEERVPLGLENPLNAPRHALLFSFTHFHSVTQTPLVYRRVELLPLTPPPPHSVLLTFRPQTFFLFLLLCSSASDGTRVSC